MVFPKSVPVTSRVTPKLALTTQIRIEGPKMDKQIMFSSMNLQGLKVNHSWSSQMAPPPLLTRPHFNTLRLQH